MNSVSEIEILGFVEKVQSLIDMEQLTTSCVVKVRAGRTYYHIIKHWGQQTMSWGWVRIENGDIYRGSWKKPDTRYGAHGNIRSPDVMKQINWTGPAYKR